MFLAELSVLKSENRISSKINFTFEVQRSQSKLVFSLNISMAEIKAF